MASRYDFDPKNPNKNKVKGNPMPQYFVGPQPPDPLVSMGKNMALGAAQKGVTNFMNTTTLPGVGEGLMSFGKVIPVASQQMASIAPTLATAAGTLLPIAGIGYALSRLFRREGTTGAVREENKDLRLRLSPGTTEVKAPLSGEGYTVSTDITSNALKDTGIVPFSERNPEPKTIEQMEAHNEDIDLVKKARNRFKADAEEDYTFQGKPNTMQESSKAFQQSLDDIYMRLIGNKGSLSPGLRNELNVMLAPQAAMVPSIQGTEVIPLVPGDPRIELLPMPTVPSYEVKGTIVSDPLEYNPVKPVIIAHEHSGYSPQKGNTDYSGVKAPVYTYPYNPVAEQIKNESYQEHLKNKAEFGATKPYDLFIDGRTVLGEDIMGPRGNVTGTNLSEYGYSKPFTVGFREGTTKSNYYDSFKGAPLDKNNFNATMNELKIENQKIKNDIERKKLND